MFGEMLIPPPPKWLLPPTMVPSGNYGLQMPVCPPAGEGGDGQPRVHGRQSRPGRDLPDKVGTGRSRNFCDLRLTVEREDNPRTFPLPGSWASCVFVKRAT